MSAHKIYKDRVLVTFSEERHIYTVRVPELGVSKRWFPSVSGVLGIRDKPALIPWSVGQMRLYAETKLKEVAAGATNIAVREVENILDEAQECWRDLSGATTIGSLAHRHLQAELEFRAGKRKERPSMTLEANEILQPDITQDMIEQANLSITAGLQFLDEHKVEPIFLERVCFSPTHGYIGTLDCLAKIDGAIAIADWKTSKSIFPEYHLQTAAYACALLEEYPDRVIRDRWVVNVKKTGGLEFEKRDLSTYSDDINAFLSCLEVYKWNRANDKYRPGSPIQPLGPLPKLNELTSQTNGEN